MEGEDLTTGNIKRQLWSLAWPIMLSIFFYTLYNIVDSFWVSKVSAEAIAAVSISQIALFVMIALSMGITVGSGVIMAMHIGAKEHDEAERVLGQSFVLAALAGVFFTTIALLFRHEILIASGANGLVFAPALEYFTVVAFGSMLSFVMMTIVFAYNAQGDTFTPTKLFALSTLVNVILDPVMIFGWAGVPAFGVAGAAYATLISQALFIVIALWSLARPQRFIRFRFAKLSFNWQSVKKVLNIGFPASLTQVLNPLGLALLMFITAQQFFEPGTIAFSIGFRIEFFAFLPAIGFGFGSMALIGQNIGAGKLGRATEAFYHALLFGAGGALAVGFVALLFAEPIVRIFTTDAVVTEYVRSYILIIALSYGFLAATMVEASTFQAIGRSWPGFWIFFIRFAVVTVPLGYVLAHVLHYPIESIWAAVAAGNIIAAIVGYWWIMRTLRTLNLADVPVQPHPVSVA